MTLDEFKAEVFIDGQVKPIILGFVDGGPDENPRYPKVIENAIDHFRKYNLDAFIVMTLASGMSAYNYVERRMAPLSKALAGILLPHDSFGNHLDSQNRTIDVELEKTNFRKAGEVLAEIWGELVMDGHPVLAEFASLLLDVNHSWMTKHCRASQYMLQIVKCDDKFCCSEMRSSWKNVFPNRFLPAPVPTRLEKNGRIIPEKKSVKAEDTFVENLWHRMAIDNLVAVTEFKELPYDYYCPSVKNVADRVCSSCGVYYPSKAAVDRHRRGFGCVTKHKLPNQLIPVARPSLGDEIEDTQCEDDDDVMPIITIEDILANSPFEEVSVILEDDN